MWVQGRIGRPAHPANASPAANTQVRYKHTTHTHKHATCFEFGYSTGLMTIEPAAEGQQSRGTAAIPLCTHITSVGLLLLNKGKPLCTANSSRHIDKTHSTHTGGQPLPKQARSTHHGMPNMAATVGEGTHTVPKHTWGDGCGCLPPGKGPKQYHSPTLKEQQLKSPSCGRI